MAKRMKRKGQKVDVVRNAEMEMARRIRHMSNVSLVASIILILIVVLVAVLLS